VNTYDESRGEGWVLFAGMMLMLAGFLNAIFGIAAIDDSVWFSGDDRYVIFDDLHTWGWFLLIVGVLQLVGSFSVWNRHSFGRVLGIACASLNAMILLFTVNAFPIAAFMLFVVDLLVIYGLTVYGGPAAAPASRDRSV
jgi:hypothetical protein